MGAKEWLCSDSSAPILLPSKDTFDPILAFFDVSRSLPQGTELLGHRETAICSHTFA
jgi:hypothetical protein